MQIPSMVLPQMRRNQLMQQRELQRKRMAAARDAAKSRIASEGVVQHPPNHQWSPASPSKPRSLDDRLSQVSDKANSPPQQPISETVVRPDAATHMGGTPDRLSAAASSSATQQSTASSKIGPNTQQSLDCIARYGHSHALSSISSSTTLLLTFCHSATLSPQ